MEFNILAFSTMVRIPEIAVANGSQAEYFLKRVSGDSPAHGPGWATWLTPLSYSNPSVTYAWPASINRIPAGKTYYYGYKYDLETGYQLWRSRAFKRRETDTGKLKAQMLR